MKTIFFKFLIKIGIFNIFRRVFQKDRLTVLFYHSPKSCLFNEHIKLFKRYYNLIQREDLLSAIREKDNSVLPPYSIYITFDDGHVSNKELFKVLKNEDVDAEIFVCPGLIDTKRAFWFKKFHGKEKNMLKSGIWKNSEYHMFSKGFDYKKDYDQLSSLTLKQIKEAPLNVNFSGHSMFHPMLTGIDKERLNKEIKDCYDYLKNNVNQESYFFAYPDGRFDSKVRRIVKKNGFEAAFSTKYGFIDMTKDDVFSLKRIGIYDDASSEKALLQACGLWSVLESLFKWLKRLFTSFR